MAEKPQRKKKKNNSMGVLIGLIIVAVIAIVILVIVSRVSDNMDTIKLKNSTMTFELGEATESSISIGDVLSGDVELINKATMDLTTVDFTKAGRYNVSAVCDEKEYNFVVEIKDTTAPIIKLKSDSFSTAMSTGVTADKYIDAVTDNAEYTTGLLLDASSKNPADDMEESLSFDEAGDYTIGVVAVDSSGNATVETVTLTVTSIDYSLYLNSGSEITVNSSTNFSTFNSETIPYGYGTGVDANNRPDGCNYYKTKWGQYAADFIQPYSEYVYLTFDCGYENGNTATILDTLKEKNVKAVFFLTLPFAEENPDLVNRMIDEGHVVGNHSVTHPAKGLPSQAVEDQIYEIKTVHDYILENFDYDMYLFRFPTGAFSEQSLAIAQSLGYRSIFWSFAHHDWVTDNQPDVAESLQKMLDTAHGGEIFLLHAVSDTNTALLADLIDGMRAAGFEFGYYAKMDNF